MSIHLLQRLQGCEWDRVGVQTKKLLVRHSTWVALESRSVWQKYGPLFEISGRACWSRQRVFSFTGLNRMSSTSRPFSAAQDTMLALGPSLGLILRHLTCRNCISDVPRTRGAQNLGEVPWSRGLVRLLSLEHSTFLPAILHFLLLTSFNISA